MCNLGRKHVGGSVYELHDRQFFRVIHWIHVQRMRSGFWHLGCTMWRWLECYCICIFLLFSHHIYQSGWTLWLDSNITLYLLHGSYMQFKLITIIIIIYHHTPQNSHWLSMKNYTQLGNKVIQDTSGSENLWSAHILTSLFHVWFSFYGESTECCIHFIPMSVWRVWPCNNIVFTDV